ncbi:MAG: ECF transporter S component [Erysipelotrichaceae bacterium]|nr:ECF transporter S component [Erysipelotrichaceae bacterium]
MRNKNTKILVTTALLTAVIVVLQTVASGIRIGPFTPTLSLIPIIIGALLYGPLVGGFLGAVFGIIVIIGVLSGTEPMSTMMMQMNPVMTVGICLVKGILAGVVPALLYKALKDRNDLVATAVASIAAPVCNTGAFCLALVTVFLPVAEKFAGEYGFGDVAKFLLVGIIGGNFLFELALNAVLVPVVKRVLKPSTERSNLCY